MPKYLPNGLESLQGVRNIQQWCDIIRRNAQKAIDHIEGDQVNLRTEFWSPRQQGVAWLGGEDKTGPDGGPGVGGGGGPNYPPPGDISGSSYDDYAFLLIDCDDSSHYMFVDAATLADYTNLYNAEQGGGVVKSGDTCWTVHPTFANPTGGAITVAQTYPSCEDCLPNCGDCHFDEGSTIDINNLDQILCRNGDSSFSEHKYYGAISFDYFDSTQWVWSGNITHELWNGVTGDNCDGGGTPDDTDTETLTINYDCASNTWYLHFVNNYIDLNHMVYDGCSGGHLVNGPSGSYDAINSGSFTVSDGGGP